MKRPIFKLVYDRILDGLPGLGSPEELAARVRSRAPSTDAAAERVIALHTALGSSQGFLFGLPGLLLLPITLPANLLAAAAVQLHMVATLATLGGENPEDPEVRERCVECLLQPGPGEPSRGEGEEIAQRTGIKLLERGARWAIARTAKRVARNTMRRVGFRGLPLFGGILGGGSDGLATRAVARCARAEFLSGASTQADLG